MQTAAGVFSTPQSVEIATLLAASGVDTIECGHPRMGPRERERVAAVVNAVPDVPVLAHARACPEDIAAVAETGAKWVGIFLGVNGWSRRHRIAGSSEGELLDRIHRSVSNARERGLSVRMTIEDSSRTTEDELRTALKVAVDAGAARLCFSDTTGALEPRQIEHQVRAIVERHPETAIEVHLHDDRGLALANALAAVDAGATWVSTSVNSLGERAGITDLAALLVNLHLRAGRSLPPPGLLQDLSRRVGAYSRSRPDDRRPIVGRNVFHHQSRLHVKAVQGDPAAYELFDPSLLGRQRTVAAVDADVSQRASEDLIIIPPVISAAELRYHRKGPGERFVLIDDRFVAGAGQYCIARRIPRGRHEGPGHVDPHAHDCDSLFGFLGDEEGYRGLMVEVRLGESLHTLRSPASVFIPAGTVHSYRAIEGSGTYLNHVLSGSYEESLLDPADVWMDAGTTPSSAGECAINTDENTKAKAWDHVGGLFWSQGRVSARPSRAELDLFLDGVEPGSRCIVVGASTKELVEAVLERGCRVTVLDFSTTMCRDLADAVGGISVSQVDITQSVPRDLRSSQDWVFSDRLLNRFAMEEATAGIAGMTSLLRPGGTLRISVKLGHYPMDDQMIKAGYERGTLAEFWDHNTSTMDFGAAGSVLDDALLPHGKIERDILLQWYRGRGREKRFNDEEVRALLETVGGCAREDIEKAPLHDAPDSWMYSLRTAADCG